MPVWSIEGIPGVGKTTVLAQIKQIKAICGNPVIVLDEPIDQWKEVVDKNNTPLFDLFYKDPVAHGFAFQMLALITRVHLLKQAVRWHPDAYIFTERCPSSDKVFAEMLFMNGSITLEQYTVYNKAWNLLDNIPIAGVIYLRADPAFALGRCLSRGREGESLTLDYLQQCNELHEKWVYTLPFKCLILDSSTTTQALVSSILKFLKPSESPVYIFDFLVALWVVAVLAMGIFLFF